MGVAAGVGNNLLASNKVASSTVGVSVLVRVTVDVAVSSNTGSSMGVSGDNVFLVVNMSHWLMVCLLKIFDKLF